MQKMTIGIVAQKLDDLSREVSNGFKGVHQRQDTTNGKVLANTEWKIQHIEQEKQFCDKINTLWDDRENNFKRYSDFIWKIGTTVILLILGLKNII